MSRRLFQRVCMEIGMDQISGKFGIEQRFRQFHAGASQQMGLFLIAMHHHGLVVFVKYRLQLGRHVTVNTIDTNRFIMCSDHQRRIGRVPRLAFAFHLQHPRMRHGLRTLLRMINGEAGGSRLRRDFTFVMQMPVRHWQIVSYPCFQCFRRINRFILRYFKLAGLVLLHGIVGGLPALNVLSTRFLVRMPNSSLVNSSLSWLASTWPKVKSSMDTPRSRSRTKAFTERFSLT